MLISECTQFIEESQGNMLFRALPVGYESVTKVKVRQKKSDVVGELFNEAFDEQYPNLRQRAILTQGELTDISEGTQPFFVFPIDGYKFMYNTNVANSKNEHKDVFDSIVETLDQNQGLELIADMLKFTYSHTHLVEGILSGAEVVLYNTPYYYAVRATDDSIETLTTMGIL
jgi:hypothetical protein